jgi:hypothetical protein
VAAAAAAALTAAVAEEEEEEEVAAARTEEVAARAAAAEEEAAKVKAKEEEVAATERAAAVRAAAAARAVETCDICLDDFEPGDLLWEMCCGKRLHCECLGDRPWLMRPNSGPRYCDPSGAYCDIVTEGRWVASCSTLGYGTRLAS